ncbi:MAG: hypothetical protein MR741_00150 [Clostridiales bacterium]|nr:hypothetical protein [Clostridiales bacterium]MDD7053998.1 hypothetical protein [Clostridiales bacterium]
MKKKIIALIMIIPIVFLIALFSVGKAAGVYADIPVTGIQITTQNEDGFIDVDVAKYDPIAFLAQVQPVNARNQKYSFEISGVGGDEAPDGFEIIDGKLHIDNVGKVKITAISAEKGFKDSVIVSAYSTKVLRIYPKVNGDEITSDVVSIDGGENVFSAELYPENLSGETRIFEEIGDNHILKLNAVTGVAQALFSGETQVRITCPEGREGLEKVLTVKVNVNTDSTGFAVNGKSSGAKVTVKNKATTAKLFVESKNDALEISDLTLPEGVTASGIERISENKFVLTLSFDKEFSDEEISGKVGATDFSLEFTEYNLDVRTSYYDGEGDEIKQKNNTKVTYVAYSESDDDVDVNFEIRDDTDVITLEQHGRFATITATKRGSAKIKITAEHDGKPIKEIEKTILVVPNVYSMEFADSAKEYGIENILTIGGKNPKGRPDARTIFVRVVTEAGAETFTDEFMNVAFSDDNSLFSCKTQTATNADAVAAEIRATGTGLTTLNAELKNYNQYFGTNICAKIRLRAVKDGRNVGNYEELQTVTEAGHIVVLTSDVMLGVKSDGKAMDEADLKKYVKKFTTTYDKTYLENSGESKEVQYLIEFRNHVYGNGFEINADKFTQCKDTTGVPKIFKGPLNFVAISSASVKGQDNISFLVRTDNVLINNVVLKGCSDDSLLEEDGQFNLSKLNYVGTTLEIAKSAKLLNCRVSNGRTVVRIFAGGSTMGSPVVEDKSAFNVQDEKINVHIESCVLSNAREFILKIGSNRALKQTNEVQRKLLDANNNPYSPYSESNKTDKYFNDNYLINDVTLKNSVLETSGLFSVGMETHFSGEFLYGGTITTWEGCAATSYASALRIVGDVKMLDWKNLSNVDSSTLIEVTGDANPLLSMNVAEMMKEVAKQQPKECGDIILNVGGTEYVHGGIAFYGGGYNYSYLDLTESNDETKQFGVYNVNIDVLADSEDEKIKNQGKMLPLAAGAGDFRFYLYNNKSSRNLSWQENIKNQGNQGENIIPVVAEDVK